MLIEVGNKTYSSWENEELRYLWNYYYEQVVSGAKSKIVLGNLTRSGRYNEYAFTYKEDSRFICPTYCYNRQKIFNPSSKYRIDIRWHREGNFQKSLLNGGLTNQVRRICDFLNDNYDEGDVDYIREVVILIDDLSEWRGYLEKEGITEEWIESLGESDYKKTMIREYYKNYFSLDCYIPSRGCDIELDNEFSHGKYTKHPGVDIARDKWLKDKLEIDTFRVVDFTQEKDGENVKTFLGEMLEKKGSGFVLIPNQVDLIMKRFTNDNKNSLKLATYMILDKTYSEGNIPDDPEELAEYCLTNWGQGVLKVESIGELNLAIEIYEKVFMFG